MPPPLPAGTTYTFNGSAIEIRSETVVNEPYVGVALELSTPASRTVHPVTALLNPPDYRSGAPPPARAPQRYGPVRGGETLGVIARSLQRQFGASTEQVMWALFDTNPHAFQGGVDGLQAGAFLTVPPAHAVTTVETERAAALLNAARRTRADVNPAPAEQPPAAAPHIALHTLVTTAIPRGAADELPSAPDSPTPAASNPLPSADPPAAVPASTTDALNTLSRRVAMLDQHAETLRTQLAERDQEVAWLQDELRLRDHPRRGPQPWWAAHIEWLVLFVTLTGTLLFLSGVWVGGRRATAGEYAEPEWIPSDSAFQHPNDTSVAAASTTQTTVSLRPKDPADAEDPLGDDDLDYKLQTRPFGESHDIDFSETDPIDELEAYIAKGQYAQAKNLLGRLINLFPDENSFRLYLLKILYAGREDEAFHEHALYLSERRDRITKLEWEEVVTMGAVLMPEEALYARQDTGETGSLDLGRIAELSPAKLMARNSDTAHTVSEEEHTEVAEFLNELRKNHNAP